MSALAAVLLHAAWWPVLLAAPVLGHLLLWADRRRARRLDAAVGVRTGQLASERSTRRRRLRTRLFAVGLLLALLAALGPTLGQPDFDTTWRGIDVVVCLDVSRSMLAQDVAPSRLVRAQQEIRALAAHAQSDRFGLVVFAGEARLLVPLTSDAASLAALAERASPTSVSKGGTDLDAALATAVKALGAGRKGPQAIVLITDGEDHAGRGLESADRCAELGIAVHTVGLGSRRGSKIAVPKGAEGRTAFIRNSLGEDVVSRIDIGTLSTIADRTGGAFLEVCGDEVDALRTLYDDEILLHARAHRASEGPGRRPNRYQWFLLAALLLLMLDLAFTDRKRA